MDWFREFRDLIMDFCIAVCLLLTLIGHQDLDKRIRKIEKKEQEEE